MFKKKMIHNSKTLYKGKRKMFMEKRLRDQLIAKKQIRKDRLEGRVTLAASRIGKSFALDNDE